MTRGIRTAAGAGGRSRLDRPSRAGRAGQGPWRESGRLRRVAPRRLHDRGRPAGLPGAGAQVQGRGRGEGLRARSPSATSSRRRASAVPTGRSSPARSRRSPTAPRCSRARSAPPPTRPRRRRARRGASPRATGRRRRASASSSRTGPQVDRVRHIVDTLLPPYLHPEDVRIYVIENKEWNAFAMGNYSIYVFTGLLDDMDDDEVAIVLGHELVHATHEHSRKQFKKDMWIQLLALGALGAASTIDDDTKQAIVGLAVVAGASAWQSGYGRGMEDQADRVGLRYAYEAGYDITKGPRLWNRFAKKYGEGNKVANFFFSDHSQSAARATKLEKEIAFNYPDGPKPDGPARQARRAAPAGPVGRWRRRPWRSRPAPRRCLDRRAAAPGVDAACARRLRHQAHGDQAGHDRGRGAQPPRRPASRGRLRRKDAVDLPGPHGGLREREGHRREVLSGYPRYASSREPGALAAGARSEVWLIDGFACSWRSCSGGCGHPQPPVRLWPDRLLLPGHAELGELRRDVGAGRVHLHFLVDERGSCRPCRCRRSSAWRGRRRA